MFQRIAIQYLNRWASDPMHKPLVLRGARQVGKTTLVNMFAKGFDHYVYLNMELPEDKKLFEQEIKFEYLVDALFLREKITNKNNRILIFIDEIQNSPKTVALLRYFYEKTPYLYVISAGSLLESMLDRYISFPVGRVEYLYLKPCTFEEYLGAIGAVEVLQMLAQADVPEYAHAHVLEHFKFYTVIGGMPEIVLRYSQQNQIHNLSPIYTHLLTGYMDDVEKYARNTTMINVIRHVIQHSFSTAGSRIKMNGFGNSSYKSREIGESFQVLEKSFFLQLIYPVTGTTLPMETNIKRAPKLQIMDTGLVNFFMNIQSELLISQNIASLYQGKIVEHIVYQEIITEKQTPIYKPSFWVRENADSNAEVDFLLQIQGQLIPVEIKSGATGTLRSLHQFIDLSPTKFAVRIYSGKLCITDEKTTQGTNFRLLNLPLYLAAKIENYVVKFL